MTGAATRKLTVAPVNGAIQSTGRPKDLHTRALNAAEESTATDISTTGNRA